MIFYNIHNNKTFLDWCTEKYKMKETVTNKLDFKYIYGNYMTTYSSYVMKINIYRQENIFKIDKKDIVSDLTIYINKLLHELFRFTIKNLSVTLVDSDKFRFQIWNQNNMRLNYTYDIHLRYLKDKIFKILKILNILQKINLINTYLNLLTNLIEGKILIIKIHFKILNYLK
jgi:hypothetical protein